MGRCRKYYLSEEEAVEYYPKSAGFHPISGEFVARGHDRGDVLHLPELDA